VRSGILIQKLPFQKLHRLSDPSTFFTQEPLHDWHKMFWSHDANLKWCIVNRDFFDNPSKEKPPLLASILSHSSAHIHQPQIDESTLIAMQHHMLKQQAQYLIKRREHDLWAQVLVHDNVHHRALIDQVCLSGY
jgi:hypothetical protein